MPTQANEFLPPEQWPALDALETGLDEHRLLPTDDLAGRGLSIHYDDGSVVHHVFDDPSSLTWEVVAGPDAGDGGAETYEALRVAPDVYLVVFATSARPDRAIALVADLGASIATTVVSTIVEEGGRKRVDETILHGGIGAATSQRHQPSADLVGKRVLYRYGANDAYEHIYLNEGRYTWHCLAGAEKGLADTEPTTTHRIADGVYLFTWRERVVPCDGVVVVNLNEQRSNGRIFGFDSDSGNPMHIGVGARAEILNVTEYDL
jgi:hypothetical protein